MNLKVCTFNIRYAGDHDGVNCWDYRKDFILDRFPKYQADIIGFQEVKPVQRDWLEENLPDYAVAGTGRSPDYQDECTAILYRKDRFQLMSLDTFWLSDTPYVPGSCFQTDQSVCPRICTCAVLLERESRQLIRIYNTHLDHVGKIAQAQGMTQILTRIGQDDARYPNVPVILTGDFNVLPDSEVCKQVSSYSSCGRKLVDVTADVGVTFHNYEPEKPGIKIDYIYTNATCDQSLTVKLTDHQDGVFLSDHYPVMAVLTI